MESTITTNTQDAAAEPAGLEHVARVRLNITITRNDGRLAAVSILLTQYGAMIDHPSNFGAIVPGDVLATLPAWLRRELEYAALTIA
jgi:hypothetical protein